MNLDIEDRDTIPDPTDADIRAAVARLNSTGPQFAALWIRPFYFMQCCADDTGRLAVEYSEGGFDRQYEAPFPQPKDAVTNALLSYRAGDNGWRTAFAWQHKPAPHP